jgi:uncharacterized membrane protein YqiK
MSQIDKVVLIDGGGSNGNGSSSNGGTLGRYANQLPIIVEQMAESFAAVTGIDLKDMVRDKSGSNREQEQDDRVVVDPPRKSDE